MLFLEIILNLPIFKLFDVIEAEENCFFEYNPHLFTISEIF